MPYLVELYIDGASRGNPGESGVGVVIYNNESGEKKEIKKYLGKGTNNQAEYNALLTALENLQNQKANRIIIHTDSQLVANQVNGLWKVKDGNLNFLYMRVKKYLRDFSNITIKYIPREKNEEADKLANASIDEHLNL